MTAISREALYDLVWAEPVRTIAQRMGVSDVWLKKCCAQAGIPVPDRGYWAKLRAGKTVVRRALPPRPPGMATELVITHDPHARRWPSDPEAELAAPAPVEPTFAEPIESVIDRVRWSLGKVRFVRGLGSAHRLIRGALDEDELRRLKPSDAPYRLRYSEPYFDTPFERRRLQILNSLFVALSTAGYQPWVGEPQARSVGVVVGSQRISFALDHPKARKDTSGRIQAPREAYEMLRLDISATGDAWTDDDAGWIEDRLTEITLKLIVAGEIQYRAHAQLAYESECRRRLEMEHKLAEQRSEAKRLAQEEAIQAEAEQRKQLLQMARDHRTAQDIRAFINDVIKALDQAPANGVSTNWISWALGIADRLDPVGQIQVSGDGTVVMRPAASPATNVCSEG